MDTVHDLGGRQGFGPVRWQNDHDDTSFHEEWQARTWAICLTMFGHLRRSETGWTLDWTRHVLERTPPAQYLAMNYFDKWSMHMMAILIDNGVADVAEFAEGRSHRKPPTLAPKPLPVAAEPGAPRFKAGDRVVTRPSIAAMHTRLPGYARGRAGTVDFWRGPEILADASAAGELRKEHLYTVRFDAAALWPETGGRPFSVYADLWESYLEPA
jgi:nitrile hydratase subunit beta